MSWGVIGAIIGLAIGIADMFILRGVAARPELSGQSRTIMTLVSYLSLIIFPIVGWYAGTTWLGAQ